MITQPNIVFILRGIQAVGIGCLWPTTLAACRRSSLLAKKSTVILLLAGAFLGFSAILLLAFFIKQTYWHWLNLVPAGCALLKLLLPTKITFDQEQKSHQLDGLAAILLAACGLLLSSTLIHILEHGFANLITEIGLFLFVLFFLLFLWRDISCTNPVLNLPKLYSHGLIAALTVRFAIIIAYIFTLFILSLLYMNVHQLTISQTASHIIPMFITMFITTLVVYQLDKMCANQWLNATGLLIILTGFWLVTNQEYTSLNQTILIFCVIILGVGFGTALPINTEITQQTVRADLTGLAMGILTSFTIWFGIISQIICRDLAKAGALKLIYQNFLRLGEPIPHWQQQRILFANQHLQLEAFLTQHYRSRFLQHFIPTVNHLYSHALINASSIVIVILLAAFTFNALVLTGKKS